MMIDFAGRLKRLRIEKGYSQATLAKKITDAGQKLGEASIAKYENGRTYPNLQTAACMADCLPEKWHRCKRSYPDQSSSSHWSHHSSSQNQKWCNSYFSSTMPSPHHSKPHSHN